MAWDRLARRRAISLLVVVVTIVTALVSLVLPWYAWTNTGTERASTSQSASVNVTIQSQVTFNVGNQVQYTLTCANTCDENLPDSTESIVFVTEYSAVGLNNTGTLYQAMFWLPAASAGFGIAGLALAVMSQFGRPKAMVPALMMLIVSVVLALSTPLVLSTSTPNRLLSDHATSSSSVIANLYGGQLPTNGTGPASTYFGSCQGLNCTNPAPESFGGLYGPNASQTWGPGSGWYLAFGTGALGLLGTFLLIGTATDPRTQESRPKTPPSPKTEEAVPEIARPAPPEEVTPLYPPMYRPPPSIAGAGPPENPPPPG